MMRSHFASAQERARQVWHAGGMITDVIEAFGSYQRAKNLSETTIRSRASMLRSLAEHTGKPLVEATTAELRGYFAREGLSAHSMRTYRNCFRAFYDFLLVYGYRDDAPSLRLPKIRVPKSEPRPFTEEQIDRMLASGAYRKTRAMILIGYHQGFRVSQIAAVHGRDIDIASNTIRTVGKGNKARTLPLSPVIAELSLMMPRDDYWFPARGGRTGHIHGASVTECVTAAKDRAGITDPSLTPHSLRHAFGTDLVEEGLDIRVVAELMMHESVATTQIYTRVSDRLKQEGILKLKPRAIPTHSGRRQAA